MEIVWTHEKQDEVCERLDKWLMAHHAYSGEMMQQDDDCQTDAINILSELVDEIIKPSTEDEE